MCARRQEGGQRDGNAPSLALPLPEVDPLLGGSRRTNVTLWPSSSVNLAVTPRLRAAGRSGVSLSARLDSRHRKEEAHAPLVAALRQVEVVELDLGLLEAVLRVRAVADDPPQVEVDVLRAHKVGVLVVVADRRLVARARVVERRRALHRERELAADRRHVAHEPGEERLVRLVGRERHVVCERAREGEVSLSFSTTPASPWSLACRNDTPDLPGPRRELGTHRRSGRRPRPRGTWSRGCLRAHHCRVSSPLAGTTARGEARAERTRAREVLLLGRRRVDGADRKVAALVLVEDARKDGRRVKVRQAQLGGRARDRHEGAGAQVADDAVVLRVGVAGRLRSLERVEGGSGGRQARRGRTRGQKVRHVSESASRNS